MKKTHFLFSSLVLMIVAAMCLAQNASAAEDLVLYLSFEETGDPIDHAPDPAEITVEGSLKQVEGRIGNGMEFDGDVANHIEITPTSKFMGMSALTIEVWVKPYAPDASAKGIVSKRVSYQNSDSYNLFLWNEVKIWGRVNANADNAVTSQTVVQDGNWYHVAYVFDGSVVEAERQKLYINGVLEMTASHPDTAVNEEEGPVWIGALNEGSSPWRGIIDEVRIWAKALSEDEIAEAMTGSIAPIQRLSAVADTWGRMKQF